MLYCLIIYIAKLQQLWHRNCMKISKEFDYRNASAVLEASAPGIVAEIRSILINEVHILDFALKGKQRDLSVQVQDWFVQYDWQKERRTFAIPEMKYDLLKGNVPIDVELGHQRLV